MNCQGCGGVVGRDCYNPTECVQINNQQDNYDVNELQYKIAVLTKALVDNNIDIPDFDRQEE